jgi:hypothetical protein
VVKIIGGRGKAPEPRRAMVCTCDMPDGVGYCQLHDDSWKEKAVQEWERELRRIVHED